MPVKTTFLCISVVSIVPLLAFCQESHQDSSGDVGFRGLEASANPNYADGDFVTIAMVGPQGVFVCEKPNGGGFESNGATPIVQLVVDAKIVEEKYYNLNKADPDEHIVFEATATKNTLGLEAGLHWAACRAFPDWHDFNPDEDPNDPWISCTVKTPGVTDACTASGVLLFGLQESDEELPSIKDLSQTLDSNCGVGSGNDTQARQCSGWIDVPKGSYSFFFPCDTGSLWEINLQTHWSINDKKKPPLVTSLEARDAGGNSAPKSSSKGQHDQTHLIVQKGGACSAHVTAYENARIKLSLAERVSGGKECHELCVQDGSASAQSIGCDCSAFCKDACSDGAEVQVDCGLTCNIDHQDYNCPFSEFEIWKDLAAWVKYPDDTDSFEHKGTCYRRGDGQQCCYTGNKDNGTGSFDICPLDGPGIHDCSGKVAHAECDVLPLCGCMSQAGSVSACEMCMGWPVTLYTVFSDIVDDDFCDSAATDNFDWCGIVGNPETCRTWLE